MGVYKRNVWEGKGIEVVNSWAGRVYGDLISALEGETFNAFGISISGAKLRCGELRLAHNYDVSFALREDFFGEVRGQIAEDSDAKLRKTLLDARDFPKVGLDDFEAEHRDK